MHILKKFGVVLLTSLSLNTFANQHNVQVVWPFAPGSSQAVMYRNLIDSANKQQTKYSFVFVNKPGAGGAVAANYVLSNSGLTVLASTSSFYSRPLMYLESHDPDQFKLINSVCSNGPLALISRKYSAFKDLRNHEISVGILPGSVTQLVTRLVTQNNQDIKFLEVPYKGTPEATTDMLAKHIDASVDLFGTSTLAKLPQDAAVVAITGTRSIQGIPTFSSLKIKGLDNLTNNYYLFVPKTVETSVAQELNTIFNSAINDSVRENCDNERGVVETLQFINSEKSHQTNLTQWKLITKGIQKQ